MSTENLVRIEHHQSQPEIPRKIAKRTFLECIDILPAMPSIEDDKRSNHIYLSLGNLALRLTQTLKVEKKDGKDYEVWEVSLLALRGPESNSDRESLRGEEFTIRRKTLERKKDKAGTRSGKSKRKKSAGKPKVTYETRYLVGEYEYTGMSGLSEEVGYEEASRHTRDGVDVKQVRAHEYSTHITPGVLFNMLDHLSTLRKAQPNDEVLVSELLIE